MTNQPLEGVCSKRISMIGIAQPSLHNIEIGKTKKSWYINEIFEQLGIERHATGAARGGNFVGSSGSNIGRQGSRDFPVYFMQPGAGEGEFILSSEAIDYVERPTLLATVRGSFGICVYGDAMSPAYEAGDIVFVHPYQPPVVGGDIVLRPSDVGDSRMCLGRLVEETHAEWKILQHKRGEIIAIKKAEWGRCDHIVGKYNRR